MQPETREITEDATPLCPGCFHVLDDDSDFCPGCNAPVGAITLIDPLREAKAYAYIYRRGAEYPNTNLLFFGTFSRMEEEAFIDEVTDRLRTEDSIYRTMARDVHQAGTVLQTKKYRMLTWAYRVFLLGLVASGIAFVIQAV